MAFTVLPDGSIRTDTADEAVELARAVLSRRQASEAAAPSEPSQWRPNRPNGRGTVERSGRFGWRWSVMIASKRHVGPTHGSRKEALDALEAFVETGVMPEKLPRAPYRCTACHGHGHTKRRCPLLGKASPSLPPSKLARRKQHRVNWADSTDIGPSGLPVWICIDCGYARCAGNKDGWLHRAPGGTEWTKEPRWCPGAPATSSSPEVAKVVEAPKVVAPVAVPKVAPKKKVVVVHVATPQRKAPAAESDLSLAMTRRNTKRSRCSLCKEIDHIASRCPNVAKEPRAPRKGATPPRKMKAEDLSFDHPISIFPGDELFVTEDFVEEETGNAWKAGERWIATSPTGKDFDGYAEWNMHRGRARWRGHPQLHPFMPAATAGAEVPFASFSASPADGETVAED